MGKRLSSACSLILVVSMMSLVLLGSDTVSAVACACPNGGVYYARIWSSRDGWLYDMCIVSFDSSAYYGYPAVCGTTTCTTTTSSATSATSTSTMLTTVISKTSLGVRFSGVKVKVDRQYYVTPFSLPLYGMTGHTFTAPSTVTKDGITYSFLRWEDQWGHVTSTQVSMRTYTSGRTFYAVYEPPSYALTVYVKDLYTRNAVAGASVYLDSVLVGKTDSRGVVVIQRVYAGWHYLGVTKYSTHLPSWATVNIRANTFTVYLTPT